MSTGYMNKVIRLDFSEWSSDPEADPIWIVIRNPKLVPPSELQGNIALNADGTPADTTAAMDSMYDIIAKLVIGWRVYDATAPVEINPLTGEETGDAVLLPSPATPELCRKLPSAFITAVAEQVKQAVNPE